MTDPSKLTVLEKDARIKELEDAIAELMDKKSKCEDCLFGDANIQNAYWIRVEYYIDEEHFVSDTPPLGFEIKKEPEIQP